MRIIAGKYKSRKVYTPSLPSRDNCLKGNLSSSSGGYRPTTDRAKETLFNVLNNIIDFDSVTTLDLFAGSGSLGFEAISRGAAGADFVETSPKQVKSIERTADELGCKEIISIYKEDVLKFLKGNEGTGYDLIFADPPYGYEHYNELLSDVLKLKFSIFVLEHGMVNNFMYNLSEYDVIEKKIGVTNFKIFVTKS